MALFRNSLSLYKSASLYEIARSLLTSRNTQAEKAQRLQAENQRLRQEIRDSNAKLQNAEHQLEQQLELMTRENQRMREQPINLPSDLPVKGHSYGPKLVCLCLQMAQKIGFRRTETALQIVFTFLGIDDKVPAHSSIRLWGCRVGIAMLQKGVGKDQDDWIWMVDHSNQIGKEKVLTILGVRVRDLPPPGKTLTRNRLTTLAVIPGESWTREDVRREYKKLAKQIGAPQYLLTDGAVELYETADVLEKDGKKPTTLRDAKHFAANAFEKLIGNSERFTEYLSKLGVARCQVQQTELSHFTPPPLKPKSRFMNLGGVLRWGEMVSYHLAHQHSQSRRGIETDRMNAKLGWVRKYRKDLASWNRCEAVIQCMLGFINTNGLTARSGDALRELLDKCLAEFPEACETSVELSNQSVAFVRKSGASLKPGERTWLSTENLESCFGAFKQLEGQHSKGGFTSLIAALPMLITDLTPALVRECLEDVSVKAMKEWVSDNLGQTLTSRRTKAYGEFKAAILDPV